LFGHLWTIGATRRCRHSQRRGADWLSGAPLPLETATPLTEVLVPGQNGSASRYLTIEGANYESTICALWSGFVRMIDVPTDLGRIRSAPTADGVSGVEDFRSLRQRHDTSESCQSRVLSVTNGNGTSSATSTSPSRRCSGRGLPSEVGWSTRIVGGRCRSRVRGRPTRHWVGQPLVHAADALCLDRHHQPYLVAAPVPGIGGAGVLLRQGLD
jgi:hypothetical protein